MNIFITVLTYFFVFILVYCLIILICNSKENLLSELEDFKNNKKFKPRNTKKIPNSFLENKCIELHNFCKSFTPYINLTILVTSVILLVIEILKLFVERFSDTLTPVSLPIEIYCIAIAGTLIYLLCKKIPNSKLFLNLFYIIFIVILLIFIAVLGFGAFEQFNNEFQLFLKNILNAIRNTIK